ncbi:MAG: hypothetical protein ACE361_26720 [Aureliella sp.]
MLRSRIRFDVKSLFVATAILAFAVAAIVSLRKIENKRTAFLSRTDDAITWDVYYLCDEAEEIPWGRWVTMHLGGGSLRSALIYVRFNAGSTPEDVENATKLFPDIKWIAFEPEALREGQIDSIGNLKMLDEINIVGGKIPPSIASKLQELPQKPRLRFEEMRFDQDYVASLGAVGVDIDSVLWSGQPTSFHTK